MLCSINSNVGPLFHLPAIVLAYTLPPPLSLFLSCLLSPLLLPLALFLSFSLPSSAVLGSLLQLTAAGAQRGRRNALTSPRTLQSQAGEAEGGRDAGREAAPGSPVTRADSAAHSQTAHAEGNAALQHHGERTLALDSRARPSEPAHTRGGKEPRTAAGADQDAENLLAVLLPPRSPPPSSVTLTVFFPVPPRLRRTRRESCQGKRPTRASPPRLRPRQGKRTRASQGQVGETGQCQGGRLGH